MKLTKEEQTAILKQVLSGKMLEKVLLDKYPALEISVIRGFNRYSDEHYIQSAHFSRNRAIEEKSRIPPTGILSDSYNIITRTVAHIDAEFNELSKMLIYDSLKQKISMGEN